MANLDHTHEHNLSNNTEKAAPASLLWTLEEAARQLGDISVRSVQRMIDEGALPKVNIGRSVRVPAARVREWVANNEKWAPSNDNQRYTQIRAGQDVCNQTMENTSCQNKTSKTACTDALTRPLSGQPTPMRAAKELDALLKQRTKRRPKRS